MSLLTPVHAPPRSAGALFVVAGAVLWGTIGTAQALSPYAGSPVGLATARSGLAGLILLRIAVLAHGRHLPRLLNRRGARRYLLLGAVAMATYQASFLTANQLSGVSAGTLVAMGSAPMFAGVLGVLTGNRMTTGWLLSTTVAVAGLTVLLTPGLMSTAGAVTALTAGASFAVYTWTSRRALDAGVPPIALLAALFVGAALLLTPFGGAGALRWSLEPGGALVVVYLAVIATVVPYLMWIRGVAATAPSTVTTLALAEPLTAAVLATARLGEPVTGRLVAGALLLGAGLVLTVVSPRRLLRCRPRRRCPRQP
ncbi:DMT family transporter [Actinoplanes sp. NPDC051494]|uniref:DMT family transporter n=1 Tax=Actinoplanes sp. NPDC051494 TaxID=3363907 RepID=UPI00378C6947